MKARLFPIAVLVAGLTARTFSAEESSANSSTSEATRSLLREDAKNNKAAYPARPPLNPVIMPDQLGALPPPATTAAVPAPLAIATKPDQAAATAPSTTPATTSSSAAPSTSAAAPTPNDSSKAAKPVSEQPTMLPSVEVSRSRINELNREIHQQDIAIEREKKNTKSTELDKALNGPKMSIPLLGGQTTQYKTTVASERVNLMEEERDILDQMKLAKTKEEKAELQKELDEVKALRRDLEKNLR